MYCGSLRRFVRFCFIFLTYLIDVDALQPVTPHFWHVEVSENHLVSIGERPSFFDFPVILLMFDGPATYV